MTDGSSHHHVSIERPTATFCANGQNELCHGVSVRHVKDCYDIILTGRDIHTLTEGFDTADLKEAKARLEELN